MVDGYRCFCKLDQKAINWIVSKVRIVRSKFYDHWGLTCCLTKLQICGGGGGGLRHHFTDRGWVCLGWKLSVDWCMVEGAERATKDDEM